MRVGEGEGRRTGSVRLGFGDVIWASAVPQPNNATARTVRRRRYIRASCVHLKSYIPPSTGGTRHRWRLLFPAFLNRCCVYLAPVREIDRRPENHLIAWFDAVP